MDTGIEEIFEMKTIKERADEYVKRVYDGNYTDVELGFIRGAQSEHEELTQWNSPECPPDNDRDILLKIKSDTRFFPDTHYFAVGFYSGASFYISITREVHIEVVGWREIHE